MSQNADFMARAIHLAEKALYTTDPNPRVGCVLVKDGVIVGEGWHRKAGGPHAEIEALRMAGPAARGAIAYVSLEPCSHHGRTPPCSSALIKAGITHVFAAMQDPNPKVAGSGLEQLKAAGIETHCGLLESSAEALNPGFCKRMRTGRPYVRSKLAMSLAELELSVRATNCLETEGITTVRDLVSRSDQELLEVRNFGETTLKEVKEKLQENGLTLGMKMPGVKR